MIPQAFLDFIRDILVNWVTGIGNLASGIGPEAAGAAIGGAAAQAGHFLALFIAPSMWPAISTTWGIYLTVWLATAVVAMVARRGKA